eukprot:TRINITY_DN17633_c0_g3_i1.p1 TRINITY_DN17633_c0_g3~~TRINITY_DN17633_c0_g3_i1.p1  ORF type:complete len:534 (+),score=116.17 TRINITY_DN17633_c0_g3_i1:159-1604(+)
MYVLPAIDWIWYPWDYSPWYYAKYLPSKTWRLNCTGFLKGNNTSGSALMIQFLGDFNFTILNQTFSTSSSFSSNFSTSSLSIPDDGVYPFSLQYYKSFPSGEFILYWIGADDLKSPIPSESFVHPTIPPTGICGLITDIHTNKTDTVFLADTKIGFPSNNSFNSINYPNIGVKISLFGIFVPPHPSGLELYQFDFVLDDKGFVLIDGSKYFGAWYQRPTFSLYLEAQKPLQIFISDIDLAVGGTISFRWKNSNYTDYQPFSKALGFPNLSEGNIKCESYFSCDNPTADLLTISTDHSLLSNSLTVNALVIQPENTFSLVNSNLQVNGNVSVSGDFSTTNSVVNITGSLSIKNTSTVSISTVNKRPIEVSQLVYLNGSLTINYVDGNDKGIILNSGELVGQFKTVTVVGHCSAKANMNYTKTQLLFQLQLDECGYWQWIIVGVCLSVLLIAGILVCCRYYRRRTQINQQIRKITSVTSRREL